MSMPIFRAFLRSKLDLGKVYLWGPGSAALVQESSANSGAELGWPLLEKRAAYMWPAVVSTEDLPLKTQLLLKDISFGALEANGPLSKISPCSCMRSCCHPLGSSMPGLCSPAGLALRTVLHLSGEGGITDVCLLCASWGGERVPGPPRLLRVVGQSGPWDRCALQDWETVASAMTLPWATREMQQVMSLELVRVLPWEKPAVGCPCSNCRELLPPGRIIHTDPFFFFF